MNKKDIHSLKEIEFKNTEAESELNEIIEEVEMDEDENAQESKKTVSAVKKYLKEQIGNLKNIKNSPEVEDELRKFEELLNRVKDKEKTVKDLRKLLKEKQKELEQRIENKRQNFKEDEAKDLILKKLCDLIHNEMHRYLNAEKKRIISICEKLWDKYKVPVTEIVKERDRAVEKLGTFLKKLDYYNKK